MKAILIAVAAWHPRPNFYYGWLVLGTAALGAFIATGVAQTVLGAVQDLIAQDMGWDRTTIAFAATAGTWISGLTMPLVGRLVDRYGPRYMMFAAALIVAAAFFALSGVHSVWQFYIAYIIARSFAGPNLQNVVPRTVAVNFFRRKRNLALGITALNRIGGEAVNIQIITLIAGMLSWRAAYITLGCLALPLAVPLALVMRKRPEDVGLLPDGDAAEPPPRAHSTGGAAQSTDFDWRAREALFVPAFWFIVWGEFLAVSTTAAVGFQVVPFLSDAGLSQTSAAAALTLGVLLGGLSVPMWGHLSDKFTIKRLTIAALAATAAATLAFALAEAHSIGFYITIAWGIASGAIPVVGSMMLGNYFGRTSFGTLTGLTGPFRTAAMGLGPAMGALLFNLTGGYTAMFAIAIVSYAAAIALNGGVRRPALPRRGVERNRR